MDKRLQENLKEKQQDYIAPFLWLHNEDDSLIVNEIQRIYDSGIRSVCLESRTHDEFCCEDWWSDVKLIFEECRKRDMRVWILDDKHFPTGYANGIFEEKYKDLQSFGITEKHLDVPGPVKDGAAVADCWFEEVEDELIAVAACKHIPNSDGYSEVIDITAGLSDGMVYFDLPEGEWRILFMIKSKSGIQNRHRAFCDKLNPKATELFIEEVYESHYEKFSEYFGNTFLGFFSDEPSFLSNTKNGVSTDLGTVFGHFPWHDKMKKIFDGRIENLAGLWFDIQGVTDKIRYEYMDYITTEYKYNFVEKLGKWCREHNVLYIGHIIEDNNTHAKTGQGPGHYFRALSGQDMSGIDVVLNQIMPGLVTCSNAGHVGYKHMNNEFFNYYLAKLGASYAHIDPQKKGRAMCEIFGAFGWAEGTKMMKYLMDHMLVRGINYYVPHAFSPKPNDTDCPPNFYDSGNNPQFKFFKNNMDYMNRMCHMLSDGMHISTCAILYDAENHWINKDRLPLEKIAKKLYDNCLDYDIIPVDYLDNIKDSKLNGEKYNVLLVPYAEVVPNEVADKLKNTDIKVVTVCEDLSKYTGEFEAVALDELPQYMHKNNFADIVTDYDGIYLRYYHYTRDNTDIYMFVNEDINHTIEAKVKLSAFKGGEYIEYDGFYNKAYKKQSNNSEVSLSIKPYHSLMLICVDVDFEGVNDFSEKKYTKEYILNPQFNISLAEDNSEEFEYYKTTDKLFNVNGKDFKPHFSGHIKYETEIDFGEVKNNIQKDTLQFELDLGYVGEVAEVYLNDKLIGTKQIPPYTFEFSTKQVNCDDINKLTIFVSTHKGYKMRDSYSQYMLFEPTGLLGPIKIKGFKN